MPVFEIELPVFLFHKQMRTRDKRIDDLNIGAVCSAKADLLSFSEPDHFILHDKILPDIYNQSGNLMNAIDAVHLERLFFQK